MEFNYDASEGRRLAKVKTYRKITTTTTTTKKYTPSAYVAYVKPSYSYTPTIYASMNALNTAAAVTLNTVALANSLSARPVSYTPTVYIAPVSSYYSPSVVVKLNINQQCSSNVGCQTGCCKYDNFYLSKTC